MTIAVVLKIGDGVVLGADSASTLMGPQGVYNVYFNAEKVVNLVKDQPIGAVVYGLGGLASRSITSLARDLRAQMTSQDPALRLDPASYTMKEVAERIYQFFYQTLYCQEFPKKSVDAEGKPVDQHASMGFLIAGYSSGVRHPEVWQVEVDEKGQCPGPVVLSGQNATGVFFEAKGQPEAAQRLVLGWSPQVGKKLLELGIPEPAVKGLLFNLGIDPLAHAAMPIQDGIDLVEFLIHTTCGFVRFTPGAPTVHPPIDVAAITPHEGFRWVRRKHYYSRELNPTT